MRKGVKHNTSERLVVSYPFDVLQGLFEAAGVFGLIRLLDMQPDDGGLFDLSI